MDSIDFKSIDNGELLEAMFTQIERLREKSTTYEKAVKELKKSKMANYKIFLMGLSTVLHDDKKLKKYIELAQVTFGKIRIQLFQDDENVKLADKGTLLIPIISESNKTAIKDYCLVGTLEDYSMLQIIET